MRIGFDARSLSAPALRGWDRYLVGLASELGREGVEVIFFHRACQRLEQRHVRDLDCEIVGLKDRGGLHWEQVALPIALWRRKVDLFHAPAEHGVPIAAPMPVVLTIHSVTAHSYQDLVERGLLAGNARDYLGHDPVISASSPSFRYWRAQVARANHVLCPSDYCRDEIIRLLRVSPGRVTTTHLAVHEQFRNAARPPDVRARTLRALAVAKPYVLYVGGFEPHKNLAGLLDVFALVRAVRPQLSLVIVGTKAVPETTVVYAQRLGLQPGRDVIFLTDLGEVLTDLYDDAELLVTLSWRETFCLPALEAMTRGIPVVASAWGASPEIIGSFGSLIDPRDHESAKTAILQLLATDNRPALADRIRAQASRFSWTTTAAKTLEIYHSLIRRPRFASVCGSGFRNQTPMSF